MNIDGKKNILFAVDGENYTRDAFFHYANKLHNKNDSIILLNVNVRYPSSLDFNCPFSSLNEDFDELETRRNHEDNVKLIESYMKECKELSINCKPKCIDINGNFISETISKYGRKKADLIVMGSGKHSTAVSLILGCTSSGTLKKSNVPVMIVPSVFIKSKKCVLHIPAYARYN